MNYEDIILRPLSLSILQALYNRKGTNPKSEVIAADLGLKTRQVDAAITKSLVRFGLVRREHSLTKVMKKESTYIVITNKGIGYCQWLQKQEEGTNK